MIVILARNRRPALLDFTPVFSLFFSPIFGAHESI
jgi:hypothetical protein